MLIFDLGWMFGLVYFFFGIFHDFDFSSLGSAGSGSKTVGFPLPDSVRKLPAPVNKGSRH